ncbi:serine/threonine-protein kinase STE20 isoform X2 [Ixodes scapularis]
MSAPPPSSVTGPEGACCVGNPRWASAPAVAAALPAPAAVTPVAPAPVRSGGHGDQRLVSAARDGDFRKIRRLLQKHRVNVNARDPSTGNTALMVASLVQDPDAMSELLQHGADPTLHSYTGQNCLDSLPGSLVQLVLGFPDYLLRESGDERRLLLAAWSGQRDQVQQLLSQRGSGGLDVNCTNGEGSTPLVLVCRDLATFQELAAAGVLRSYDPLGVIRVLLDHAILIHRDVNHQDRQGRTALHYASHTCCEHTAAVLSLLLQNGAKVDIKDKHGFSPLHFAGQAGSVDAVQLLLDAGADPSATGLGAIAPLHLAASAGKTAAVRLLLERGADVLSFAQDGKSPLCCAGSTDVYSVLRRAVESALCDRADQLRLSPLDQERQQPGQPGLPSADQSSPGSSTAREEGSSSGEPSEPEAGPPAPSAFRRYRAPGWRQKSPHGGSHFVRDRWACPEGSLDSYHRHGTMPCHSSLEPAPETPSRPETGERARPGGAEVADCTTEAGAESPAPEADRARAVGTGRDAYARVRPRNAPDSESGDEERRQSLRRRPVGSRRKKPHHHANKSYHLSRLKLRPEPVAADTTAAPRQEAAPEEGPRVPTRGSLPGRANGPRPGAPSARGLMSKLLPPWVTRDDASSHLSSASWVYLPSLSPEEGAEEGPRLSLPRAQEEEPPRKAEPRPPVPPLPKSLHDIPAFPSGPPFPWVKGKLIGTPVPVGLGARTSGAFSPLRQGRLRPGLVRPAQARRGAGGRQAVPALRGRGALGRAARGGHPAEPQAPQHRGLSRRAAARGCREPLPRARVRGQPGRQPGAVRALPGVRRASLRAPVATGPGLPAPAQRPTQRHQGQQRDGVSGQRHHQADRLWVRHLRAVVGRLRGPGGQRPGHPVLDGPRGHLPARVLAPVGCLERGLHHHRDVPDKAPLVRALAPGCGLCHWPGHQRPQVPGPARSRRPGLHPRLPQKEPL